MKRRIIFVCLFYCFFILQIYEAIAAIFWQSASYVFLFRRHYFCYDHMTSQPLFVHSFMQFQLNCMFDVIFALSAPSFFVHARD